MTFPITFYVMAAASSLCVSAASLPFWRKWCMARGLIDNPGHRKIHDAPVPLAGGLAVMTGLVVPLIAAAALLWAGGANGLNSNPNFVRGSSNPFSLLSYGLHKRFAELTGIVAGGVGMLVLGLLDDRHELRPGPKFMGQFLIALLVASSGVRISVFIPNHVLHYIVTILWILTVINALNFMDNMNGLCAGLGIIASLYFGILAAIAGQYLVALIAFAGAGAMLGFLPHNFPRARAFLGDSGSHLVGYLLAVLAILPHFYTTKHPHRWAVLVPLLVLAIPLLDLAWVVVLRTAAKKPFWIGDTNHLSHRLVKLGLSRAQAVAAIWLMAALIGLAAFRL